MKKQYGGIVPISVFLLFVLVCSFYPQVANAQSNRNPCIYINTANTNCVAVGTSVTGVGNSPMPVGGLATAAAPTFVEGLMGGLSFDLSGNLRVISAGSGGSTTVVGNVSNASSAVAATSTNLGTNAYNYGYNGATWDQLQVDTNKFLKIVLPAETTKVIGTVNQGTSPWVISGAVTNTTAAGENHIGEVGGNILPITATMTTANATTTTGQSIGGLQTLANAVRISGSLGASGTSGIIQSTMVTFKDAVGSGPLDVYYFNASPSGSTCTNNSAFILADADRDKVVGISHVTDFTASNTAAIAQAQNQAIPFGVASATSIFACVVARASFVITSTANASLIARILRN